jgi:hypothetical protein
MERITGAGICSKAYAPAYGSQLKRTLIKMLG